MLNRKMSSWKWLYHCRVHCMRACCLHQRRWGDPTRHLQSCQTASASTLLAQTATWLQTQNPNRRRRGWRREGRELLENRLAKKKKRKKKKNTKKKMEKKWNNEERDNEERWKWLERWNLGDLNEWFENEMEGKKKKMKELWNLEWNDFKRIMMIIMGGDQIVNEMIQERVITCVIWMKVKEKRNTRVFGSFWEVFFLLPKKAKREQVLLRKKGKKRKSLKVFLLLRFFE